MSVPAAVDAAHAAATRSPSAARDTFALLRSATASADPSTTPKPTSTPVPQAVHSSAVATIVPRNTDAPRLPATIAAVLPVAVRVSRRRRSADRTLATDSLDTHRRQNFRSPP